MPAVLYFAYGSNMDPSTLRDRRGIGWTRSCPARAGGWRLVIDKPSLLGTAEAMASIVQDARAVVWGVLYEISEPDYAHLELTEGVAIDHYQRVEIDLDVSTSWKGNRNGRVLAHTLVSDDRDPSIRPTTRYRDLLVRGAIEHGLPAGWIDSLRAIDAVEEGPEAAAMRPFFDRAMRRED